MEKRRGKWRSGRGHKRQGRGRRRLEREREERDGKRGTEEAPIKWRREERRVRDKGG